LHTGDPSQSGKTSDVSSRVLVVDDDPEVRALIKMILSRAAFEVELCEDAESALVHLRNDGPYDVIVTDFMMPGISGIEFIAMVRAGERTARLPILMVSGHTNYAMGPRAISAGADHFLEKPFKAAELRSTVAALAAAYHRRAET
jgi:DNA-binding response OmpR family regulator